MKKTFTAFGKEYHVTKTQVEGEYLLEIEDVDPEQFFQQINRLEKRLTKEVARRNGKKPDFSQDFEKLKSNFEEGLNLRITRKESIANLQKYCESFSMKEYYDMKRGVSYENEVIAKCNTLVQLVDPYRQAIARMSALFKENESIFNSIDEKSDGLLSQLRENFGTIDPFLVWDMEELKELVEQVRNDEFFFVGFAEQLYHAHLRVLNNIRKENAQLEKNIETIRQEIQRQKDYVTQFRQENQISKNETSAELKQIERDCANQIFYLKEKIDDMTRAHAEKIESLIEKHKDKILSIGESHKTEVRRLLERIEILEAKIAFRDKIIGVLGTATFSLTLFAAGLGIELATGFFSNRNQEPIAIEHQQEEYQENPCQQHPLENQIEFNDEFYCEGDFYEDEYSDEFPYHGNGAQEVIQE